MLDERLRNPIEQLGEKGFAAVRIDRPLRRGAGTVELAGTNTGGARGPLIEGEGGRGPDWIFGVSAVLSHFPVEHEP